jgi:AcrR family transcriptional regulator
VSSHLPQRARVILEPRKSPVQARSTASVDAILQATIQVLLQVGKERLTTTRVALRAGVSVGTLYQYFPNKSSLLQAALKRHLTEVAEAVERVCDEQKGKMLHEMVTALITTFLAAKMRDARTSVARSDRQHADHLERTAHYRSATRRRYAPEHDERREPPHPRIPRSRKATRLPPQRTNPGRPLLRGRHLRTRLRRSLYPLVAQLFLTVRLSPSHTDQSARVTTNCSDPEQSFPQNGTGVTPFL